MRFSAAAGLMIGGVACLFAWNAEAQLSQSFFSVQRGDFLIIGNTLGQDCGSGVPAPVVGTVGACGVQTSDSSLDVFWKADSPAAGQAEAGTEVISEEARSTSVLALPEGATVTRAWLIWGGRASVPDNEVILERPDVFSQSIAAASCLSGTNSGFGCFADITEIVQSNNSGAYRFSGLSIDDILNVDDGSAFAGWSLIVAYELSSLPVRSLHLYTGYGSVVSGAPQTVTVSGMVVPWTTWGQMGVVAFEGDGVSTGDTLSVDGIPLANPQNPVDNIFNGTRSSLGVPLSMPGDLPQLTGSVASLTGIDLDVFDLAIVLQPGGTSLTVHASSSGDAYSVAALAVAVDTLYPEVSATKTVQNLTYAGEGARLGDTLRYTVTVSSVGTNDALGVELLDELPATVELVPGSMEVISGPGTGALTEEDGDDTAEYDGVTNTLVFRLGDGANTTDAGSLTPGSTVELVYDVVVISDSPSYVENQGAVSCNSLEPGLTQTVATDADTLEEGLQPTTIQISVPETCNGEDDDLDGVVDNGFSLGEPCTSGLGVCFREGLLVCDQDGAAVCDAVPGTPELEVCDGIDNNCDGQSDEGFGLGEPCSVGQGECLSVGEVVCSPSGATVCSAEPGQEAAEACDGKDNDCDGAVDNGFDVGAACETGIGACSSQGHRICLPDGSAACDAIPGEPQSAESCGDDWDDDCDGSLTNGCECTEPGQTRECGTLTTDEIESGGPCKLGVEKCTKSEDTGLLWGACEGLVLPADETCGNGIDDNCNGDVDENCSLDSDGDGVSDATDNCPDDANPDQKDSDDDGIGDICQPGGDVVEPASGGSGCGAAPGGDSPATLLILLLALVVATRKRQEARL